jgi:hypothetical protein
MEMKTTFYSRRLLANFHSFFSFVAGCGCIGIRWGLPQEIRFLSDHNLVILYSIKEFLFDGIQFVSTSDIEESNRVKYSMPLLYLPVICFGIIAGKMGNQASFRILLKFYLFTLRLLITTFLPCSGAGCVPFDTLLHEIYG